MPARKLSGKEYAHMAYLANLHYPEDEEVIFHLSRNDFKIWLYGMNPREALLLCSTESVSDKVVRQLNKNRFKTLKDFLWRLYYG